VGEVSETAAGLVITLVICVVSAFVGYKACEDNWLGLDDGSDRLKEWPEMAKAKRERQKELDQRAARIIRERGINEHEAAILAEKEYREELAAVDKK
jgi:hypothetical protein